MASLVGVVLGAVVGSLVKTAADLGVNTVQQKLKEWREFEVDIGEIQRNLELKLANLEQELLHEVINPCKEQKISLGHMVDLAYDIEDCLDRMQRCSVPWFVLSDKVKQLKTRLKEEHPRKQNNSGNTSQSTTTSLPPANASSSTSPHEPVKLVGIDNPRKEILQLLNDIEGQQEQTATKVICIVGFSGTGKSTLAEEVFKCKHVVNRFPCRGRVIASQYKDNPDGLLEALIKEINPRETDHVKNITDHLKNKRYFIVLDDVINKAQWISVKTKFPDTTGGVIIVTTKDQTVAIACRSDGNNGFLYNMRNLSETHSSQYLGVFLENRNKAKFKEGLRLFANKCDGHPLSLDNMTKYLSGKEKFTETDFRVFWNDLGDFLKSDKVFRKLEEILEDSYRTLDSNDVRAFLLYLCLFPNGHPIRRKQLTRRWFAEGYSTKLDTYLQKLVEKNVVETLESSKDEVKCCRVHGIIHGFIMHMSKPTKFIASAGSVTNIDRGKYRHLYFKDGELEEPDVGRSVNSQDKNSFRAHSLTVCGRAGKKVIGDLPKCKVLRVLDLEECDDLESDDMAIKDLDKKLWHLKYLSLGPNIGKLPEKVDGLHRLEVLDMRKTKIDTIPAEVIKMRHLAHLLGRFKLEKTDWDKRTVDNFFVKESNLKTLAGFVTDGNPGFPMLMAHMKKLNKVKIWCDSTGKDSMGFNALLQAIKVFIQARLTTCRGEHSLSLYLGDASKDILSSLWDDGEIVTGYLSSLKLDGALSGLTQFATLLCGLKELCLSSTNGLTTTELSKLHKIQFLKYLKLVNVNLAGFEIRENHFPNLLRLCLVQCHGSVPTIQAEALPCLDSLWIIDEVLVGLSGIKLENHKHLQEVALDSSVGQETITSWDKAAKKHPKRPKILFFKCVSPNGPGSMVKLYAVERADVEQAAEAKEKAAAEANEREGAAATERAAPERSAAERAQQEARKRAERAASAAEARQRQAAAATAAAAASAARGKQSTPDDLESFSGGARVNSTLKQKAPIPTVDSMFGFGAQVTGTTNVSQIAASSSALVVASATSFGDLFGDPASYDVSKVVEGESEERICPRLELHERTHERAAKALAEKNERDMQVQREQAERDRIGDTLDFEIKRWSAGKDGNLRALLSSLQYILWPECGWQAVSLTDLNTEDAVKKQYRKAVLCIHPDKLQQKGATLMQKCIAEKVFDILKEAWNKFNSEELF